VSFISSAFDLSNAILYELILFAAVGLLIGGIDDLIIDIIWLVRICWRQLFVYSRHDRVTVKTLRPPTNPGPLAVFVPAWDEGNVIAKMAKHAIDAFKSANVHIFVGCYPNDPKSIAALAHIQSRQLTITINDRDGPTTKADCLNNIWEAMRHHEETNGFIFKAIILHDAEDFVHPAEPLIFDRMIEMFDLVQLPVHPLVDPASPWVSGHYCDEFAEAHTKALVVRETIGAAVPAAGVGCAISRQMMDRVSETNGTAPFDGGTLTEDYELGLKIRALGGRTALIRIREQVGGPIVAVHAHFPSTIETAVRQKTRWTIGIALAAWDRLGWNQGWFENWMRLRDRRAPMAALIICAGYLSALLFIALSLVAMSVDRAPPKMEPHVIMLLQVNGILLLWRLCVRAIFVAREYNWREGLKSIPRTLIANIIAILAARRAVLQYAHMLKTHTLVWDKTEHHFPDAGR
jgi:bacteriophage N4 adsorption protein B